MIGFVLIFTFVLTLILFGLILYSNYRAANNIWLSLFYLGGSSWILANILTNYSSNASKYLLFSRLTSVGAGLMSYAFLNFCISFLNKDNKIFDYRKIILFIPILFLFIIGQTKFYIESATASTFKAGFAYYFLFLILILYFSAGSFSLVKEYRRTRGSRKNQIYLILVGFWLSVIPSILFEVVLPLFNIFKYVSVAPSMSIFFEIFTFIAIFRHKLLDVRVLLAKYFTYVLSLLFIMILYGFILLFSAKFIFNIAISFKLEIVLISIVSIISLSFTKIQKYFSRISNQIFYQDSYIPQEFYDSINKIILNSDDITSLIKDLTNKIQENFKCYFAGVVIDYDKKLSSYKPSSNLAEEDVKKISYLISSTKQQVLITDLLSEVRELELKEFLIQKEISLIVRLSQKKGINGQNQGYVYLSNRRSGNQYNSLDISVLNVVITEFITAVEKLLNVEEIKNLNLNLQDKINAATSDLRRSNEKLRQLDESKDDFISMASHQLRTPLTSVKGYLSMVLEGDAGKITKVQKDMLDQAFFSSQRMTYIISDLLNVSRLKTGKFVIERTKVNLAKLIEEEIGQLTETALNKKIELIYDKPKNFPDFYLDETKTRQVVMNFMDNALYYTPHGGEVRVELFNKDKTIEFRISDNGIGVPRKEQAHLFTKFYRAGNARKVRPDGTGLGLYMAKKVIIAEGGSIIFESQEGEGSTFGFEFLKDKISQKTESDN